MLNRYKITAVEKRQICSCKAYLQKKGYRDPFSMKNGFKTSLLEVLKNYIFERNAGIERAVHCLYTNISIPNSSGFQATCTFYIHYDSENGFRINQMMIHYYELPCKDGAIENRILLVSVPTCSTCIRLAKLVPAIPKISPGKMLLH